ncbi:MAG: MASE1 domain-containing protein [Candidatus Rokuibacteriota bacterium]
MNKWWTTWSGESRRRLLVRDPLVLAALFAVYVLAGKIGLSVAFVHANASAVWPPTGIALAAFLVLGHRSWLAIFAGAFVVNATTAGSVATSLGIATGNTLEGLVGAHLVNRFANGVRAFDRVPDVFKFAVLAALLSTTVSATIGVTSLSLGGYATWADSGPIWLTWWLGNAAGAMIFAPLLVLWMRSPRCDLTRRRPLEAASLLLSTVLVGLVVFGKSFALIGLRTLPLTFLCTSPLIWAAFRFRPCETATVMALTSAIAIWGTWQGSGPFASATASEPLLLLQAFLGTVAMMVLPAAALVEERRRVDEDRADLLAREHAARAEAENANEVKDEFLAMIGHELRNPLAVIISAVSVLDRVGSEEDVAARARGAIRHQITHLSRLVDDLLDVVRVTSGKVVLACQPVNLATSVQWTVSLLAGTGRLERHVVDVRAEPVWVHADPARLDQIVANLLTNATRYTPPGGTIRIRVESDEDEAVVSVEDTGIGISPELLPRIFDRGGPGERRLDLAPDGLGVGLTLVRRLVDQHGGRIEASSDGPGRGSQFVVRLPCLSPVLAGTAPVVTPRPPAAEGRQIGPVDIPAALPRPL